jgi:CBS-domain-containing membrane protein
MSFAIATSFDKEERKIYMVNLELDDITQEVIKVVSEDCFFDPAWALMDDDTWLREIPVIEAQHEANCAITKAKVLSH